MINIKSKTELALMRDAGRITALAREAGAEAIKEGVTTASIDAKIKQCILSHGATPSFLGYGGFPASACISVNDEVIHGIPGERILKAGDLVKIDVGAMYKGYHGDCAGSYFVGDPPSEQAKKLVYYTEQSFYKGVAAIIDGARLGDVSAAIGDYLSALGYGVIRDFVGHGIGREMHEDPSVPNYGRPGRGVRLSEGMVLAIEPMVTLGTWAVTTAANGWTVYTNDHSLAAHYENTVAITQNGPEIFTTPC